MNCCNTTVDFISKCTCSTKGCEKDFRMNEHIFLTGHMIYFFESGKFLKILYNIIFLVNNNCPYY